MDDLDKEKEEAIKKFEFYEKGVQRLNELEEELNSISTRKFKQDEDKIRAKLKNVSLIPEIEKDIALLRKKIAGIDVETPEFKMDSKQQAEIEELKKKEKEMESKIPELYAKINSLEEELKKAENLSSKQNLTDDEQKLLEETLENKRKIAFLKNLLEIRNQQLSEEIKKAQEGNANSKESPALNEQKKSFFSRIFSFKKSPEQKNSIDLKQPKLNESKQDKPLEMQNPPLIKEMPKQFIEKKPESRQKPQENLSFKKAKIIPSDLSLPEINLLSGKLSYNNSNNFDSSDKESEKQKKMRAIIEDAFSFPKPYSPIPIPELKINPKINKTELNKAPELEKMPNYTKQKPAVQKLEIKPDKKYTFEEFKVEKPEKPKKLRVPKKKFIDSVNFKTMINEMTRLKGLISRGHRYVGEDIALKSRMDNELLKMTANFEKIKENLIKINSNLSFRTD